MKKITKTQVKKSVHTMLGETIFSVDVLLDQYEIDGMPATKDEVLDVLIKAHNDAINADTAEPKVVNLTGPISLFDDPRAVPSQFVTKLVQENKELQDRIDRANASVYAYLKKNACCGIYDEKDSCDYEHRDLFIAMNILDGAK